MAGRVEPTTAHERLAHGVAAGGHPGTLRPLARVEHLPPQTISPSSSLTRTRRAGRPPVQGEAQTCE
eukprot:scaffold35051_cov65-Phaeocystis_antarctica.AAC.5